MGLQIPTEVQSPSPFEPGSGGLVGFFYFFLLFFCWCCTSAIATLPQALRRLRTRRPTCPGGFRGGFLVPLHPGDAGGVPGAGWDVPRAGKQAPGPCLRSPPAFTILPLPPLWQTPCLSPVLAFALWHRGMWAEPPVMGVQAEPPPQPRRGRTAALSQRRRLPGPATASEQNEKILDLFSGGKKKKKKKIQYSVCDPRLCAWLWQENAVNLPFPHQLGKKDRFSFNILIFFPGLSPVILQAALQSLC